MDVLQKHNERTRDLSCPIIMFASFAGIFHGVQYQQSEATSVNIWNNLLAARSKTSVSDSRLSRDSISPRHNQFQGKPFVHAPTDFEHAASIIDGGCTNFPPDDRGDVIKHRSLGLVALRALSSRRSRLYRIVEWFRRRFLNPCGEFDSS